MYWPAVFHRATITSAPLPFPSPYWFRFTPLAGADLRGSKRLTPPLPLNVTQTAKMVSKGFTGSSRINNWINLLFLILCFLGSDWRRTFLVLLLTFVDYCWLLLMTLVMHPCSCSPCNRRTISLSIMMMMNDNLSGTIPDKKPSFPSKWSLICEEFS